MALTVDVEKRLGDFVLRTAFTAETGEALALLARRGGSRERGARPLRQAEARLIADPAADLLLSGGLRPGDVLHVLAEGDRVVVRPERPPALTPGASPA